MYREPILTCGLLTRAGYGHGLVSSQKLETLEASSPYAGNDRKNIADLKTVFRLRFSFRETENLPKVIELQNLGTVVSEGEGRWVGSKHIYGRDIEFSLDERNGSIDPNDIAYCLAILNNFESYLNSALIKMASNLEIDIKAIRNRFKPISLFSITTYGNQNFFYMGLVDTTDEDPLWRVQFDGDVATFSAADT